MRRAIAIWAAVLAVYCVTLAFDSAPGRSFTAGETRVLLVTKSIVDDGDIDLRNQYREQQWREFTPQRVPPRAGVLSGGQLLEPIGIGLPLIVAPAYAIGGATGVQIMLAALLSLAVVLACALARRLTPDPWATGVVLALGLSPPMLAASTAVSPEGLVAALLAGAAILALRIREETRLVWATWCATFLALLPWIGLRFVIPGVVVAVVLARWLRRRRRGLAGFVALELVFVSIVVYLTIADRLYGGLTPDAVLPAGVTGTGAHEAMDYVGRLSRLAEQWVGPATGLLWWAPGFVLFFAGVWRLYRSKRERLWKIAPDQIDVDVTATMYLVVSVAGALAAALTVAALHGVWYPGHDLVPVFAFGAGLAAWGAARYRRAALVLLAVTAVTTVWFLAGGLLGDGVGLDPPHGPLLPWGGLTDRLGSW
jgi:hypothetical protein